MRSFASVATSIIGLLMLSTACGSPNPESSTSSSGKNSPNLENPCATALCSEWDGIIGTVSDVQIIPMNIVNDKSRRDYPQIRFNWKIQNNTSRVITMNEHVFDLYDTQNLKSKTPSVVSGFGLDCPESLNNIRIPEHSEFISPRPACFYLSGEPGAESPRYVQMLSELFVPLSDK